jgi:hypothetical protein
MSERMRAKFRLVAPAGAPPNARRGVVSVATYYEHE